MLRYCRGYFEIVQLQIVLINYCCQDSLARILNSPKPQSSFYCRNYNITPLPNIVMNVGTSPSSEIPSQRFKPAQSGLPRRKAFCRLIPTVCYKFVAYSASFLSYSPPSAVKSRASTTIKVQALSAVSLSFRTV